MTTDEDPRIINLDDIRTSPDDEALFKEPGLIASGGWSMPAEDYNPYGDGLAALLYAHGAVAEARDMDRKLRASGGKVPKNGFPTRCTNCDDKGVRCVRDYAHPGDHMFWPKEGTTSMTDHELPPKHISHPGIPTRVIDDNKAVEFLRNKFRENTRKVREVKEAIEQLDMQARALRTQEAQLHDEQRHLQEAIATLKGVIAGRKNKGQDHDGS